MSAHGNVAKNAAETVSAAVDAAAADTKAIAASALSVIEEKTDGFINTISSSFDSLLGNDTAYTEWCNQEKACSPEAGLCKEPAKRMGGGSAGCMTAQGDDSGTNTVKQAATQ